MTTRVDRWPWASTALALLSVAVWLAEGFRVHDASPSLAAALTIGPFRHGGEIHLWTNLALLLWLGAKVEDRIGPWRALALAAACILAGGLAQAAMVGVNFIGISGVVLGFGGYAVARTLAPGRQWIVPALGAVGFGIEAALPAAGIAVWVHGVSFILGGLAAMFDIFGASDPRLRPMQATDVAAAVAIIAETDEDDAYEAETQFLDRGTDGMFVLRQRGRVIGVTGYTPDPDGEDVAWLGWTYLAADRRGQGLGRAMFGQLLDTLTAAGMRKLFIATSDYREDGEEFYAAAHRLYESFGAEREVVVPDYHGPGEAKIVMALTNAEHPLTVADPAPVPPAATGLRIVSADIAPESEATVALAWAEGGDGMTGLEKATKMVPQGQQAVIALPGDLSTALRQQLVDAGFQGCGSARDYYAPGLDQVWWRLDLGAGIREGTDVPAA